MRSCVPIVFLAVFLLAAPAVAQPQCDDRAKVLAHLATKYQESSVAIGVTSSGGLVEVLNSPEGKTWTIIVTTPQGMTCLLAAGDGWQELKAEPARPET